MCDTYFLNQPQPVYQPQALPIRCMEPQQPQAPPPVKPPILEILVAPTESVAPRPQTHWQLSQKPPTPAKAQPLVPCQAQVQAEARFVPRSDPAEVVNIQLTRNSTGRLCNADGELVDHKGRLTRARGSRGGTKARQLVEETRDAVHARFAAEREIAQLKNEMAMEHNAKIYKMFFKAAEAREKDAEIEHDASFWQDYKSQSQHWRETVERDGARAAASVWNPDPSSSSQGQDSGTNIRQWRSYD
jgi:hypothetical protein